MEFSASFFPRRKEKNTSSCSISPFKTIIFVLISRKLEILNDCSSVLYFTSKPVLVRKRVLNSNCVQIFFERNRKFYDLGMNINYNMFCTNCHLEDWTVLFLGSKVALGRESVLRMGRVVDDAQLSVTVVVAVAAVDDSVGVFLFNAEHAVSSNEMKWNW